MIELEEALVRILSAIQPLEHETVALTEAADRVLAEPIVSPVDLPRVDNSAMDGYAVRAADLAAASAERPASLQVRGKVAAGGVYADKVAAGTCVRLFTGSPLPEGADAVVMQEDTRLDPSRPDTVWFLAAIRPWENVRLRGEDAKRGATLAEAGDRLTFGQIGLLAAAGLLELKVSRQPRVALLATGSELAESGGPLQPGQIYESNRAMLAALLKRAGARPDIFPLVPDTMEATRSALERALARCDAAITTGGVSVGEFDFVKAAFVQLVFRAGHVSFARPAGTGADARSLRSEPVPMPRHADRAIDQPRRSAPLHARGSGPRRACPLGRRTGFAPPEFHRQSQRPGGRATANNSRFGRHRFRAAMGPLNV